MFRSVLFSSFFKNSGRSCGSSESPSKMKRGSMPLFFRVVPLMLNGSYESATMSIRSAFYLLPSLAMLLIHVLQSHQNICYHDLHKMLWLLSMISSDKSTIKPHIPGELYISRSSGEVVIMKSKSCDFVP